MINVKELRVGNFLSVDGNIWEVDTIINGDNPELYFKENIDYDHFINAIPINISKEILTDFGFLESRKGRYFNDYNIWFKIYSTENGYIFFTPDDTEGFGKPMEFVHELQNLYFALTGEELKYNSSIAK